MKKSNSEGKAITFEQFAAGRGFGTAGRPTSSHVRKGNVMSTISLRNANAQHYEALRKWQVGRDTARTEYEQLVESGEIVFPSRVQRLRESARGHEDLASVRTARNLLRNMRMTW